MTHLYTFSNTWKAKQKSFRVRNMWKNKKKKRKRVKKIKNLINKKMGTMLSE